MEALHTFILRKIGTRRHRKKILQGGPQLMSLVETYAPHPVTERGSPTTISVDIKTQDMLVYGHGTNVYVRSIADPTKVLVYTQHTKQVTVAKISPSGHYVASGDVMGNVRVWALDNEDHTLKFELERGLGGPVLDLQWSPDSQRIACVGEGREVYGRVFMYDSGSNVGEISGHSKRITTCDFKQTRPFRVVTGSDDMQVNWFEGPPFKFKQALRDHSNFVNCVRFAPDGSLFATCSSDKKVCLYDGKTATLEGSLVYDETKGCAHDGSVYHCAWSPDSQHLLTVSADKSARIWHVPSRSCVHKLSTTEQPTTQDMLVGCVWASPSLLFTLSLSGHLNFFNVEEIMSGSRTTPSYQWVGHQKIIERVAYDKDSKILYTASYDGVIAKWRIGKGNLGAVGGPLAHTNQVTGMSLLGSTMVSCSRDDTLKWSCLESNTMHTSAPLDAPGIAVYQSHTRTDMLFAVTTNAVHCYQGETRSNSLSFQTTIHDAHQSPDESTLAIGCSDGSIHLLSTSDLSETRVLKARDYAISRVRFSKDGRYLAAGDANRELLIFDLLNGELAYKGLVFHTSRITAIDWCEDSMHLITASVDSSIIIWDLNTPTKPQRLTHAHRGTVNDIVYIGENQFVSVGDDACVRVWQL